MKKTVLLSLIALATLSCSNQNSNDTGASFLDDCDVVAAKEVIDGDTVIVCDYNKVMKQRKNVPLDELLTDFNVLKMDNENEEGLIGRRLAGHIVGKNHIAVFCYGFMPLKLYNKQGKFIRNHY